MHQDFSKPSVDLMCQRIADAIEMDGAECYSVTIDHNEFAGPWACMAWAEGDRRFDLMLAGLSRKALATASWIDGPSMQIVAHGEFHRCLDAARFYLRLLYANSKKS